MAVEERKNDNRIEQRIEQRKNDSRMQEGGKRMTAEENKEWMRSWNESSTHEEGNNDNIIERRRKEVKRQEKTRR